VPVEQLNWHETDNNGVDSLKGIWGLNATNLDKQNAENDVTVFPGRMSVD